MEEAFEGSISAKHSVHVEIIARVVFVVGSSVENRGKIDRPDTEGGDIRQIFRNAIQVAAKENVIRHRRAGIFPILRHAVFPVRIQYRTRFLPV